MTSKPKKNTRKEIRGWVNIKTFANSSTPDIRILPKQANITGGVFIVYRSKEQAKKHIIYKGMETVKPCRIILD